MNGFLLSYQPYPTENLEPGAVLQQAKACAQILCLFFAFSINGHGSEEPQ